MKRTRSHKILYRYEGYVEEVTKKSFFARLVDLSDKQPDVEAEFKIKSIPAKDRHLIEEGRVFRWTIMYNPCRKSVEGVLRFRFIRPWTPEELKEIRKNTEEILRILDVDG